MFMFGSKKRAEVAAALKKQALGGQSMMYSVFIKALRVPDERIRKIELTYFSLSVLGYAFLRLYQGKAKEKILDAATLSVIQASIRSCGESMSGSEVISEYQKRFQEYEVLIMPLFSKGDPDPNITLLMHVFESVTQGPARGSMVQIATAAGLINQYVVDNLDFVKTRLEA